MNFLTGQRPEPTFAVSRLACTKEHPRGDACTYRVAWTLNPHMRVGAARWRRAAREHRAFLAALRACGARLVELPFVHGAFDCVFAKDNAVLAQGARGLGPRALLAHPRHDERRQEQAARARALEARGFDVWAQPALPLEGGDVVVLPGGRGALLGHGFRTDVEAAGALERFLGAPVVPVRLRDPALYHLDMACTALSDGTVLVCPEALAPGGLHAIERAPGVRDVVAFGRADALTFSLNMVEVGGRVLLGAPNPRVEAALQARGWEPVVAPLTQFHLAGGSAACLVARVHPDAEARAAETPRRASMEPTALGA